MPALLTTVAEEQVPASRHPKRSRVTSLIITDPPIHDRFVTCVPFYELKAGAGDFGPEQPGVDPADHTTWIQVRGRRLARDIFVIQVTGRSMEPKIPDGSYCLFRGGEALAGMRQGRIMLIALKDSVDPETGGRLTAKRYESEEVFGEDGEFRHLRIRLLSLNPDYRPIVLDNADEDTLKPLGEFVAAVEPLPQGFR